MMRNGDPLGAGRRGLDERLKEFLAADLRALKKAADTATTTSRSSFKRKRDIAPPRPGRSGSGQMTKGIQWSRVSGQASVALRMADLNKAAPHWIIQEIGTGQTANIMRGADGGPETVRATTIPSQKGRRISSGLMWATKGRYSPPNRAGGTENLFPRIGPAGNAKNAMVIRREIEGQGFIKKGADTGFREYEQSVLTAARRQFRKRSR